MNDIIKKQNTDKFIDFLCAQRFSYSRAKTIFIVRVVLSGLFAVLGPVLILKFKDINSYIAILAILYATVDFFLLRSIENKYRQDGAKIQELFDVNLFNLEWNEIVAGERPDSEKIYSYAKKYRNENDVKDLINWYSNDIAELELSYAIVICQRINVWWDVSLRRRLFFSIVITMIFIVVLSIFFFHKDIINLLLIIATLIPLFEILTDYVKSQWFAIIRIKKLKNKLDSMIEGIIDGKNISSQDIRIIQDEIYRHRASCVFVPDWFYRLFRDVQEEQMNYSTKYYVDRISKN